MDFKLLYFVLLCIGGCSAGVVPQNFKSIHNEPFHLEEKPISVGENENNSTLGNSAEITSNVSLEDNPRNTSQVSTIHSGSIEELEHVKSVSKGPGLSKKGASKGSGRPKKGVSKGSSRFKKGFENTENVTRGLNFSNKDIANKSDNVEATSGLNHSDEGLSNGSDHGDRMKGFNHSDHGEGMKGFNHSDHGEGMKGFNHSDHGEGMKGFNHSDHGEGMKGFNHSDHDIAKGFVHSEDVIQTLDPMENISRIFDFVKNDTHSSENTLQSSDSTTDHFDNISEEWDHISASFSRNSSEMAVDNQTTFSEKLNHTDQNTSIRSDLGRNFSEALTDFNEDLNAHTMGGSIPENITPETDPLHIHPEFLISSENDLAISNATDKLGSTMDIHNLRAKDNTSDVAVHQTKISELHLQDNSSEINSTLETGHFNNTGASDAFVMFTVAPNEEDTNSSTKLSDELHSNFEGTSNNSESNVEVKDTILGVEEESASQGLLSTMGFDFLINSELAKNAATAMEVFNFSDSALTDHIIDENNDMHDLLDLVHPSATDDHDSKSSPITTEQALITVNETALDNDFLNSTEFDSLNDKNTSVISEIKNKTSDLLNPIEQLRVKMQGVLNRTGQIRNRTEATNPFESGTLEDRNGFEVTTTIVPQSILNSTVEFVDDAICPPPGICIFWFMAQDTCSVNSHCLGSRICCRIRCAKTCIEV